MKPLFGPEGRAALARLLAHRQLLLAFDFDGTLAPIVARPDDARIPLAVARRMAQLCRRWPVAVITGRAVADVVPRLGFEPRFVVGNHGIEDPHDPHELRPCRWTMALDPLRHALAERAAALADAGVTVEDKRLSIALHYRLAPDEQRARRAIDELAAAAAGGLVVGSGKAVVNLMPAGAPDKGDALLALARRCHAEAGLFVGDDDNDEAAFRKAPRGWLSLRVGPAPLRSHAAYYIDGVPQLPVFLQAMLEHAPAQ